MNYEHAETKVELYDLKNDVSESKDVAEENPEIVKRLMLAVEAARDDLGDRLTKRTGKGVRPAGVIE